MDETGEEELRRLRWQVIQAIDEHPQNHVLERLRATARTVIATARDFSEDEFANNLEKQVRTLLRKENRPTEDT